jgi:dienelactone hydrolase
VIRRIAAATAVFIAVAVAAGRARADEVTIPPGASTPGITGYLMRPNATGPAPAVLVLHGCEGYGTLETTTVNELAQSGYVALAIDALRPQGLRSACGAGSGPVRNTFEYAIAALQWLAQQSYVNPNRLAVVGFSMGAIAGFSLIDPLYGPAPTIPGLRAEVLYYPACSNRSANINVPLLILDGSADDWIPPGPCQELARNAAASGKPVQIVTYPGATHAFNQPSGHTRILNGHTLTYDPQAAADADSRMRAFLQTYLH